MPEKRIEFRSLDELKNHPRQEALFADLNDGEFEELRKSMERGLDFPVEITPDNVVIDGHQRLRAARELGWERIQVWVRDDLVDQSAIDQRHIEANLDRRQLGRLEQARLIRALCDLERERHPRRYHAHQGDVRDRIGKRFGMDGRTAQRWMNLLDTPQVVQEAVSLGTLPMLIAEQLAHLRHELKQDVADRIRAGEAPTKVANEVLARQTNRGKQSAKLPNTIDELERIAKRLEVVDVDTDLSAEDAKRGLDVLTRCADRCCHLARRLKRPAKAHHADASNSQSELKSRTAT
jgi:ParB family chromosome partitioning protein